MGSVSSSLDLTVSQKMTRGGGMRREEVERREEEEVRELSSRESGKRSRDEGREGRAYPEVL